jgi:hypothetical protein
MAKSAQQALAIPSNKRMTLTRYETRLRHFGAWAA